MTIFKSLFKWVGWFTFISILLLFFSILIATQFDWHFNIIPTSSMEPTFKRGGLVVSRPTEMKDINVGDPILFYEQSIEQKALICHRVIEVKSDNEGLAFRTQGDANDQPDSYLVTQDHFVGKTIRYIPHIGTIANRIRPLQTPVTMIGLEVSRLLIIVLILGLYIVIGEIKNIWEWLFKPGLKRRRGKMSEQRLKILKRRRKRHIHKLIFD